MHIHDSFIWYLINLEIEEFLCVIVADVLYHLVDTLLLVALKWHKSVLYVLTNKVAESAAEILVTRI